MGGDLSSASSPQSLQKLGGTEIGPLRIMCRTPTRLLLMVGVDGDEDQTRNVLYYGPGHQEQGDTRSLKAMGTRDLEGAMV